MTLQGSCWEAAGELQESCWGAAGELLWSCWGATEEGGISRYWIEASCRLSLCLVPWSVLIPKIPVGLVQNVELCEIRSRGTSGSLPLQVLFYVVLPCVKPWPSTLR